jgi:citrate lyase subunit beta-like protein
MAQKNVVQMQAPNLDTIVVPKVQSAADLHFVTDVIRHIRPSRSIAQRGEAGKKPV